jgi:hypothetical protein
MGKPDETDTSKTSTNAEILLKANPEIAQVLLTTPGTFTDYSGRTFNCTAYEYAYWAKDTHMCRMLERYMNDETKAKTVLRIKKIESQDAATNEPVGLSYLQNGSTHHSAHFDLSELKSALQAYLLRYNSWAEKKAACLKIGMAQRDLPVHVINEYCRKDRSFFPCPEFKEDRLPRELLFSYWKTATNKMLFPLVLSTSSGLGLDFSLVRGKTLCWGTTGFTDSALMDFTAISHLDEVRTSDLSRSLKILEQKEKDSAYRSEMTPSV